MKMLDLPPHLEVMHQVQWTHSRVEEQPFNPAVWAPQILNPEGLSRLAVAENQIEELSRLQENWDGYGGIPINEFTKYHAMVTVRGILVYAPLPDITPNPNGTLSFEWETPRGVAHLEVGQTKMSFYIKLLIGEPVFSDANTSDTLLNSIKIGSLVSAYMFPLQHETTSITKIDLAANVSHAY
jgi:hypothetical protein